MSTGNKDHCAVLHAPGYVPGECSGEIHLYRPLKTTAKWWLCDADVERGLDRGIRVERIEEPEVPS